MTITVKLFALFRPLFPQYPKGVVIIEDCPQKVSDLIDHLKLPPDIPKIIFVNGVLTGREMVLQSGDTISIFPYISGG